MKAEKVEQKKKRNGERRLTCIEQENELINVSRHGPDRHFECKHEQTNVPEKVQKTKKSN